MLLGVWPQTAIFLPWDIWIVTWIVAALWTNRTIGRPGFGRELLYRILALAGFYLLLIPAIYLRHGEIQVRPMGGILGTHLWMAPLAVNWAMVVVAALGFAFAWWARIHLGRLWSGRITRKEGHRVVDTGAYALVRHPIYTGIITAGLATMVVLGNLHAVIGAGLLIVAYWMKARIEEDFLREQLGPSDYDAYRARVAMLIPFGPK
ncbi:MAG: isoprenylcysteine carboxylmethyltransferase family protein [Rhizomicrobium sp.]